jgi:hypothetical protein
MTFESKHPFAQLAIDVAISLALFVVACVFSGWAQNFLTPNLEWMYSFWFALGMLPCLLYMRYRAVANFDNWDIVAFSPMPLVLGIAGAIVGHQLAMFAIIPFVPVCLWIRRFLPQRQDIESKIDTTCPDGVPASKPNAG